MRTIQTRAKTMVHALRVTVKNFVTHASVPTDIMDKIVKVRLKLTFHDLKRCLYTLLLPFFLELAFRRSNLII